MNDSSAAGAAPLTDKRQQLLQLKEGLAKATGPDRELDCEIGQMLGAKIERRQANYTMEFAPVIHWQAPHPYAGMKEPCPRFTASLDAAVTLVPEKYRNWWSAGDESETACVFARYGYQLETRAATVPLALCLARVTFEIAKLEAE
jgi:hypothetical protein